LDFGLWTSDFVGQQQFRHVLVAFHRGQVQRRLAQIIRGMDVGLVGQQQFRHVLVAVIRRDLQWRPTESILGVDLGLVRQQ
jgi:hypothetical protein